MPGDCLSLFLGESRAEPNMQIAAFCVMRAVMMRLAYRMLSFAYRQKGNILSNSDNAHASALFLEDGIGLFFRGFSQSDPKSCLPELLHFLGSGLVDMRIGPWRRQ